MIRKFVSFLGVFALATVALAGGPGAKAEGSARPELKKMTVDEVAAKLEKKEIYLYDTTTSEHYAQGHLPGAVWLKYDAVAAKDLPVDKGSTLVFYCGSERCMACHKTAYMAQDLGYGNVFIMPAGTLGWKQAGKAIEKAAVQNPS